MEAVGLKVSYRSCYLALFGSDLGLSLHTKYEESDEKQTTHYASGASVFIRRDSIRKKSTYYSNSRCSDKARDKSLTLFSIRPQQQERYEMSLICLCF